MSTSLNVESLPEIFRILDFNISFFFNGISKAIRMEDA